MGTLRAFGRRELPDLDGARGAPSPARLDRESEQTELGGLDELGVRTGVASLAALDGDAGLGVGAALRRTIGVQWAHYGGVAPKRSSSVQREAGSDVFKAPAVGGPDVVESGVSEEPGPRSF